MYYKIFSKMFFSSQIYLKAIFYTAQSLLYILTKNLNTTRTPNEMKQNLFHWIFFTKTFVSLIKLLNTSVDQVYFFSQSYKISFLMTIGRKRKILYMCFFPGGSSINYFMGLQIYNCASLELKKDYSYCSISPACWFLLFTVNCVSLHFSPSL